MPPAPRRKRNVLNTPSEATTQQRSKRGSYKRQPFCENPKLLQTDVYVGDFFSRMASRTDTFHSYNAVGLNLLPDSIPRKPTKISLISNENTLQEFGYFNDRDEENPYRHEIPYSPTNGTFYPWTLPREIISPFAYCAKLPNENKLDLLFTVVPTKAGEIPPPGWINIKNGIMINSLSGLRIGFTKEVVDSRIEYFVTKIGDRPVLHHEYVVIDKLNLDALQVDGGVKFQTSKDEGYEVILDFEAEPKPIQTSTTTTQDTFKERKFEIKLDGEDLDDDILKRLEELLRDNLRDQITVKEEITVELPPRTLKPPETSPNQRVLIRRHLHAILSSGIGAQESPPLMYKTHQFLRSMEYSPSPTLNWKSIYVAGLACESPLPSIAATYPVILLRRGKCPFSQKLNNIPTSSAIKLAIVVNFDDSPPTHKDYEDVMDITNGGGVNDWHAMKDDHLIRPLVDQYQVDSRNGQRRKNPVALVFVGGGEVVYRALAEARGVGLRERWKVSLDGLMVGNMVPAV
ncbi:hypothetical protein ABW19_dt0203310 [Dactylella cylindrospora]|nr:hypothetical protein ABW19_dt0203310 [Dactylella cylindrospora]